MPTIAHLSDLHLQSDMPERQAQVEPILDEVNRCKPDLVVISGDVTHDGWESIDELKWAKDWLDERVDSEWFAVPGNHDVGNFATQEKGQINEARVDTWEKIFGWNVGSLLSTGTDQAAIGWRILGFNSMLYGSSVRQEKLETRWLNQQKEVTEIMSAGMTIYSVAFIHSPFFIDHSSEVSQKESDYWLGPKEPRVNFYDQICGINTCLIGSGHVHQTRLTEVDGVKIAWAPPASGTWVHALGLPNPPMPKQTGFFLHDLHDDGQVQTELIECAPMLKLYEHNP